MVFGEVIYFLFNQVSITILGSSACVKEPVMDS